VVGKAGFEPATSASRTLRANQAALLPGGEWSAPPSDIVVAAEDLLTDEIRRPPVERTGRWLGALAQTPAAAHGRERRHSGAAPNTPAALTPPLPTAAA
jgi:hypothetical protein